MRTQYVDTLGFLTIQSDWRNYTVAPSYPPNTFTPRFVKCGTWDLFGGVLCMLCLFRFLLDHLIFFIAVTGGSFGRFDCGAAIGGHGLLPTTKRRTTTVRQNTHTKSATKMQRTGTAKFN